MPIGNPDLAPLVGSWRLISAGTTFADTDERIEHFGPNPDGRMVLSADGRIMFIMTKSDRQPPANDVDRAILFHSIVAYTGLVRSDVHGRFITTVDLAWTPAWAGEQLRFFTINDDRLTITTPEQTHPQFPGRLVVGDLVWERENLIPALALISLVGSWRLVSAGATFTDNGERVETWGPDPDGRMVLAPGGRIMFMFTSRNRPPPSNESELVILFNDLLSYTGTVRLDGPDRFITTVDAAKDPADVGKEWLRHFTLDGDRLVIRLPEQTNQFSHGRMAVFDAIFIRENR